MSVIYNGLYSIDFVIDGVTYNTWKTFGLIPKRKPIIMPPEPTISINSSIPNKYYLDESGSMMYKGYLDSSHQYFWDYDADVQFRHRIGEWEFITNNDIWAPNNDTKKWIEHYRSLVNTLHGKKLSIKLNNYDDIYYDGYVEITNYSSEDLYSTVTMTYYILENAEYWNRFYNDIIPEFPEQESSVHSNSSDKIDYSTGPTTDFVIDNGGDVDINYDEVPPEFPDDPDNPDDPENPDEPIEPSEHRVVSVRYDADPEPYTADGWTLAKSGYFELNDTIQINDDYYVYKNDSDAIPLKSITPTGYGIEYRIHIYTNNPINYNVILYNDYDNNLNDKCYESDVALNSKKYNDCYKMYTNNIKAYINNPWIYIILSIKQDIGLELLPNSFSYFIYINTNNTAVAVPGQDKFSINFNDDVELINRNVSNQSQYTLIKHGHGLGDIIKFIDYNDNIAYYQILKESCLEYQSDTNSIEIIIVVYHSTEEPISLLKGNFDGDSINFWNSSKESSIESQYNIHRDFYRVEYVKLTNLTNRYITAPVLSLENNRINFDFSYYIYINESSTNAINHDIENDFMLISSTEVVED